MTSVCMGDGVLHATKCGLQIVPAQEALLTSLGCTVYRHKVLGTDEEGIRTTPHPRFTHPRHQRALSVMDVVAAFTDDGIYKVLDPSM